jgi:hypothetical protein
MIRRGIIKCASIGTEVQRYYGRAGLFGSSLDCALQSPLQAVSLCPHYHVVGYGQGWEYFWNILNKIRDVRGVRCTLHVH